MEIRGKKVVLRDKKLEDAWNDYNWKRDPELARLDATLPLDIPFPIYLRGYAEELGRADVGGHSLAIETLEGRHIGNCSYYHIDRVKRQTELGIIIGDQTVWDRGCGTDAVSMLVDYLFKVQLFQRIYLHTLVFNARAQKCFRKCGFVPVRRVFKDGYDFLLMEISSSATAPSQGEHQTSRHV